MIANTEQLMIMSEKTNDSPVKKPNPFGTFIGSHKSKPTILKRITTLTGDDNETKLYHYVIVLATEISSPDQMLEVVDLLRNCNKDDIIEMVITTPGGRVDTMMALLTAMDECKALIATIANGLIASCGFIIWTYGDIIKCRDYSYVMAHSSSQMLYGKTLDIIDYAESSKSTMEMLFKKSLDKGILTIDEYNQIMDERKDVYLSEETLRSRIAEYNRSMLPEGQGKIADIVKQSVLPHGHSESDDSHDMIMIGGL